MIDNSKKVEICSEVAMLFVEEYTGKCYEEHSYFNEEEMSYKFNKKYQKIFNEFYDITYNFIETKLGE